MRCIGRLPRRPRPACRSRPASAGRVLVAMSGGVDSAVAALLCAQAGDEVVAVTLKLWADQEGDGERSCCSPQAVIGARALAHSMGLPHLTLDLEDSFRAAVVDAVRRRARSGPHAEPVRALQRPACASTRCSRSQSASAPSALATGHYARIERRRARARCWPAPPIRDKDQTYMLSALRPAALARVAVPARRAHQAPGARDRRGGGPAGGREAREPGPVLSRRHVRERFLARHGGVRDRPGEVVDAGGRVLGRHPRPPSLHRRAAPGPGRGRRRAAVRALHRRCREPGRRRSPRRRSPRAPWSCGTCSEPRRAARGQREAALPLRAVAVPRGRRAPVVTTC